MKADSADAVSAAAGLTIRHCEGTVEFEACALLEKDVWAFSDLDAVPVRFYFMASNLGGQLIGAFDKRELVAFVVALPGVRNSHTYLYSRALAVREEYRNAGLGMKLKLAQREDALARGFDLVEWTFDPLEIKNAYLNLEKLGAIARRYNVNQYGSSSSQLQGGLPTDRLVAEWWIRSKRVESLLDSKVKMPKETRLTISVPAEIALWKASPATRPRAAAVQSQNREQFLRAFHQGMVAQGLERDKDGNGAYLLGTWDEKWSYDTLSSKPLS